MRISSVVSWMKSNYMLIIVLTLSVIAIGITFAYEGFAPLSEKIQAFSTSANVASTSTITDSFTDLFKLNDTSKRPVLVSKGEIGIVKIHEEI